jgi:isopentenyldiphosphate isomerase
MQENDFVYVYFGGLKSRPRPHPDEIAGIEFVPLDEIRRRLGREPETFAAWFRHYFAHHREDIGQLAKRAARLSTM